MRVIVRLSEPFRAYRLAAEYGLVLTYKKEFHEVFEEHQDIPEFKELMVRMKVVDANGESAIDEDQWDAASTFRILDARCGATTEAHSSRYLRRFCF